ncbi:hypothetical protein [Natronospora cellulosivora (SeqCode)]
MCSKNRKSLLLLVFLITGILLVGKSNTEAAEFKSGVSIYNDNYSVKVLEISPQTGHSFYINSNKRFGKESYSYLSFGLRYYLDDNYRISPFITGEFHSFDNDFFYRIGGGYRLGSLILEGGYRNYGSNNIYFGLSLDYSWQQGSTYGHIKIRKESSN